ncbi:MAG: hypothetical protein OXR62_04885 [Ahrensia sp.]|nr:hypothetical protein [Ahrensia sp.]
MAQLNVIKADRLNEILQSTSGYPNLWCSLDKAGQFLIGANPAKPDMKIDFGRERVVSGSPKHTPNGSVSVIVAPPETDTGRTTGAHWIRLNGEQHNFKSQRQLLRHTVLYFAARDEAFLERLSLEKTPSRRLVARNKYDLFKNKKLTDKHSEPLTNGWWLNTNNSGDQCKSWIRVIARISGHSWADKIELSW